MCNSSEIGQTLLDNWDFWWLLRWESIFDSAALLCMPGSLLINARMHFGLLLDSAAFDEKGRTTFITTWSIATQPRCRLASERDKSQMVLLFITLTPYSSYCSLVIHIFWKLGSDARIDPPIHTENLRSGWAAIFISFDAGTSFISSFSSRFRMPSKLEVSEFIWLFTRKHGWTTREYNISVHIGSDVHVALHDRLEQCLVHAGTCMTK